MTSERTTNGLEKPNESTRLLHHEERGDGFTSSQFRGSTVTPLPKAQLGALVAARVAYAIAYTQIYPYVNQLLANLHIAPPEQVGLYSGFIESAYSLAEMLSVYQWGRLSDIIGRRPVVIFTLMGIAVMTIAFGWSTSLIPLLLSRLFGGLVAGNIAVLHSILVEITDDTNQNIAVPTYSLSWSMGSVIGSLIGGTFANAATRYPKYFSWPLFVDHPYLPPCVISAACTLLGVGLGYWLIEETLPSKRKSATNGVTAGGSTPHSDLTDPAGYTSAKALLSVPGLRALTLSGLVISFLTSSFNVVFALFCYIPVDAGGLGLQPSTIGGFLAFGNTFAVLLRLVVMPYILRRFDYAMIYITCMYLWPFTFAFLPLLNALALVITDPWIEPESTTRIKAAIWIGTALVLTLSKVATIPFSIVMFLIKRHVPTASGPEPSQTTGRGSALGRSNGLVQFSMCLGGAFGPVVVNPLFTALNRSAWAREWGISWTWSAVMVCFAILGARLAKDIR